MTPCWWCHWSRQKGRFVSLLGIPWSFNISEIMETDLVTPSELLVFSGFFMGWWCLAFKMLWPIVYWDMWGVVSVITGHLWFVWYTVKLVYKHYTRGPWNVVHRWSLCVHSITWKVYPLGPVKYGLYKLVVLIYRWSLEQAFRKTNISESRQW